MKGIKICLKGVLAPLNPILRNWRRYKELRTILDNLIPRMTTSEILEFTAILKEELDKRMIKEENEAPQTPTTQS